MNKVELTEEQLALLNGNNADVEELSLSDLFAIAGGCGCGTYPPYYG